MISPALEMLSVLPALDAWNPSLKNQSLGMRIFLSFPCFYLGQDVEHRV